MSDSDTVTQRLVLTACISTSIDTAWESATLVALAENSSCLTHLTLIGRNVDLTDKAIESLATRCQALMTLRLEASLDILRLAYLERDAVFQRLKLLCLKSVFLENDRPKEEKLRLPDPLLDAVTALLKWRMPRLSKFWDRDSFEEGPHFLTCLAARLLNEDGVPDCTRVRSMVLDAIYTDCLTDARKFRAKTEARSQSQSQLQTDAQITSKVE